MDFNRLQSLIAAPLASLFVILCLCWFGMHRPEPAVGINVPTPKMRQHSAGYGCEDDRWLVVWLRGGGKIQINETPMERERLGPTIRLIFENRVSRVAYLMADPGVNVAEAAWALDRIESAIPGMHVVLMTPGFKKLAELPVQVRIVLNPGPYIPPYIPPCDWEWAENGYEAPSIRDPHDELFYMRYLDPQKYFDAQK
jgi:biopolymer transport protein ExbD